MPYLEAIEQHEHDGVFLGLGSLQIPVSGARTCLVSTNNLLLPHILCTKIFSLYLLINRICCTNWISTGYNSIICMCEYCPIFI